MPDTVGSDQHEPISLRGIANKAKADKQHRFQDLYRCLDAELLLDCWHDLNKSAASGVEGVTAAAYKENLQANIEARGNSRSLYCFYRWAIACTFKWLNRRSQRRRYPWARFTRLLDLGPLAVPCVTEVRRRRVFA